MYPSNLHKCTSESRTDSSYLEDLILRVGLRDDGALREFASLYRRYAMAIIRRFVWDEGRAEEVYHDALLKLYWRGSVIDEEKGSVLAYFHVLVKNTAIDSIRGKQIFVKTAEPIEEAYCNVLLDPGRTPEEQAKINSDVERLRIGISELSPALRKPVKVLFETGETLAQIAENLQMPIGTVKTSIRRGMRELRLLVQ